MNKLVFNKTLLFLLVLLSSPQLISQNNFINKGNAALKQADYGTASEHYENALLHCGENEKAWNNSAVLAAMQGDTDEALSLLNQAISSDKSNPNYYFNRAILSLNDGKFETALEDLKTAEEYGMELRGGVRSLAEDLQQKALDKKIFTLEKRATEVAKSGDHNRALKLLDEALLLSPAEPRILFRKALIATQIPNPFVSLEALDQLPVNKLSALQKKEYVIMKAYNLGIVNRMKEAVSYLEEALYLKKIDDLRMRKLLSYYYLRLGKYDKAVRVIGDLSYDDPNAYLVAGNAAFYSKSYAKAYKLFAKAAQLDKTNIDVQIGLALCIAQKYDRSKALSLIDELAKKHPESHYVHNARGVIHKDVGLHYKNNHSQAKAGKYFLAAAGAFLTAAKLRESLADSYNNNRALALYFNGDEQAAKQLWQTQKDMMGQNNLALLEAGQRNFSKAYYKLDSLHKVLVYKKKNASLVEYNRNLARKKTRVNNNYKFITYYLLHQEKPTVQIDDPFMTNEIIDKEFSPVDSFVLEYSDKECVEKLNRPRVKKKKRFRLLKRKNKRYKGQCPSF